MAAHPDLTAPTVLRAGADALATGAPPALLFTDVRMPGDDGLVLLERLKQRRPELPVVVMSAYTDIASTAGAFRAGAHEFLSKPFDLDEDKRVLYHAGATMASPALICVSHSSFCLRETRS